MDDFWSRLALRAVTPQSGTMRVRERVSISPEALAPLLDSLRASRSADEWLVLATCGRTEVYAVTSEGASFILDDVIGASLRTVCGADMSFWHWPVRASGLDAARHLLRVAGGIDSVVLGDVQLLGQLRTAYGTAQARRTTGPLLNKLCQTALGVGKRARAETGIAQGPASIAAAAVQLAARHVGGMDGRRVVIVGGGQMGRAIASALSRQRCERITMATRAPDAFADGPRHVSAVRPGEIPALLPHADVVFAASGSGRQLITCQMLASAMAQRQTRALLILDLAMPQNVNPNAAVVPGVSLVTLEKLERALQGAARSRSDAVEDVERIVEETLARVIAWSSRVSRAA